MAIIKAVSSHAGIKQALNYVMKTEKTEERLLGGYNCSPDTVREEMYLTKQLYHKTGGRTYKHFVQSFAPEENVTPGLAHAIARALVRLFPPFFGFEVLIATHRDRKHVHSHMILNSVSFADGHKFQMSAHDLQDLKDLSDKLCRQNGLSVCERGYTFSGEPVEETSAYKKETYHFLKQAEAGKVKSYVQETAMAVLDTMDEAVSREDFIEKMNLRGFRVDWQQNHKYITFTDPEGMKVRNRNLEKTYHIDAGKEALERVFEKNAKRKAGEYAIAAAAKQQLDRLDARDAERDHQAAGRSDRSPGETNKTTTAGIPEKTERKR